MASGLLQHKALIWRMSCDKVSCLGQPAASMADVSPYLCLVLLPCPSISVCRYVLNSKAPWEDSLM